MVMSSQTPEAQPEHCGVCGSTVTVETGNLAGDTPCIRCGHLLWFAWEDHGETSVLKPLEHALQADSLDKFLESVVIRPGTHLVLDLTKVHLLASAVYAKLINLKRRVASVDGRLSMRNLHPEVRDSMRITHLDHVFDLEP